MFSVGFSFSGWLFTELAGGGWISVKFRSKVTQRQGNGGVCVQEVANELVSGSFLVANNSAKVLFITFHCNSIWYATACYFKVHLD